MQMITVKDAAKSEIEGHEKIKMANPQIQLLSHWCFPTKTNLVTVKKGSVWSSSNKVQTQYEKLWFSD